MIDERDELIDRVVTALSPLPPLSAAATGRVLAAVRAHRERRPGRLALAVEWLRAPSLSVASAGMLAAAALAAGFFTRSALSTLDQTVPGLAEEAVPEAPAAVTPAQPAAESRGAVRAVQVPVVFDRRDAKSVSIVGDFNRWDATASPMQRSAPGGPWTATVLATPGRHMYAFLVDGTTLVADPRAPRAADPDYGGATSVLMVTAP